MATRERPQAGFSQSFVLYSGNIRLFLQQVKSFSGKFVFHLERQTLAVCHDVFSHQSIAEEALGDSRKGGKIGGSVNIFTSEKGIELFVFGSSGYFGRPRTEQMAVMVGYLSGQLVSAGFPVNVKDISWSGNAQYLIEIGTQ
ncbi:MAG: hypothetical protein KJ732_02560 [Candidatus Margulisbacteria bacterium]|nr:hypothetical protein [Candidatus Margulisiibacteriota bacterium]